MQLVDPSATYSAGSTIEITTEAYTDTGKDWVALFAEDQDYTNKDATYVSWAYAAASGTTTITAPDTAGKYTLVYFGEDARHIITTREITVE